MTSQDQKIKSNILDYTRRAFTKTQNEGKSVCGSYFPKGTNPFPSVQVDICKSSTGYSVTYWCNSSMWSFEFSKNEVENKIKQ